MFPQSDIIICSLFPQLYFSVILLTSRNSDDLLADIKLNVLYKGKSNPYVEYGHTHTFCEKEKNVVSFLGVVSVCLLYYYTFNGGLHLVNVRNLH